MIYHLSANNYHISMMIKEYHINIFYSNEDEGYIADILDLESCNAFGEAQEEAITEVLKAKKICIEAALENRIAILEVKYKPIIYQF